ncbi:hypothetical protein B0O80DRAFT_504702 [Mortierella sp. GBAus27b]|nr:hypothetical protein B0O80DRAFT_504702 [Mortierella sp. GBAus27b]
MLDDFITTSIDINADPATIYSILTDLSRYHEWNPHMFEARGDIAVGQTILVRVKAMDVHPTVIVADKDKQLTWSNVLFGVPGLSNCNQSDSSGANLDGYPPTHYTRHLHIDK